MTLNTMSKPLKPTLPTKNWIFSVVFIALAIATNTLIPIFSVVNVMISLALLSGFVGWFWGPKIGFQSGIIFTTIEIFYLSNYQDSIISNISIQNILNWLFPIFIGFISGYTKLEIGTVNYLDLR